MLDLIQKVFSPTRKIDSEESEQGCSHAVQIATCALFLEMAQVDGQFDEGERTRILEILEQEYDLSKEVCTELTEIAESQRRDSIDLWNFTNLINENFTEPEKIRVVELLWQIVYADGMLDQHEDYLVHKLATLLKIRHDQLIAAKIRVLSF